MLHSTIFKFSLFTRINTRNGSWTVKNGSLRTKVNVDTNLKSPHVKLKLSILYNAHGQLYPQPMQCR